MQTVSSSKELNKNIETLYQYLESGEDSEVYFAKNLIRAGTCFVHCNVGGQEFFAPSRFIGYRNNDITKHSKNLNKDGRVTNREISRIVGRGPEKNNILEEQYFRFCKNIGIEPKRTGAYGSGHKFWLLVQTVDSIESAIEEFDAKVARSLKEKPERRYKRLQESQRIPNKKSVWTTVFIRNPDVVAEVLYRSRGKCGECGRGAPFKRLKDNSPYLEVHHRVQLASGGDDTVENAIALCPNCHRKSHFG